MSLDTLLRDAAESGGPPAFDESDVASRVRARHRRRRGALAVGAVVVVVACGAAGLAVAARGGDQGSVDERVPVDEGIPVVPITTDALVGAWVPILPDGVEVRPNARLRIAADGTYGADLCNLVTGYWGAGEGLAALSVDFSTLAFCGAVPDGESGIPTLYADGLLRWGDLDFRRADAEVVPDPAARRAPSIPFALPTEDDLVGEWTERGGDARVAFAEDGSVTFADCGEVTTTWMVPPSREVDGATLVEDVQWGDERALLDAFCGDHTTGDRIGFPLLTEDGVLVLPAPGRVIFLRRAAAGPVDDAAPAFVGRRWVLDADRARETGGAARIELQDDGTFAASAACGVDRGTWVADGDGAALTVTEPAGLSPQGCSPDPTGAMTIETVEPVDGGLLARYEPVPTFGEDGPIVPEQLFRDLDTLPVPTADRLVGDWSSPLTNAETRTLVRFAEDGSATIGTCAAALGWEVSDTGLRFEVPDDDCVQDHGFVDATTTLDARLDHDVLYLAWDDERLSVLVQGEEAFHDTQVTVDGPYRTLVDAYAELGVERCCNGGFVWEGHPLQIADVLAGLDDTIPLTDPTDELDGRVTVGEWVGPDDVVVGFACGGHHFYLSSFGDAAPRDVLLSAGEALIDVLPCTAAPLPN